MTDNIISFDEAEILCIKYDTAKQRLVDAICTHDKIKYIDIPIARLSHMRQFGEDEKKMFEMQYLVTRSGRKTEAIMKRLQLGDPVIFDLVEKEVDKKVGFIKGMLDAYNLHYDNICTEKGSIPTDEEQNELNCLYREITGCISPLINVGGEGKKLHNTAQNAYKTFDRETLRKMCEELIPIDPGNISYISETKRMNALANEIESATEELKKSPDYKLFEISKDEDYCLAYSEMLEEKYLDFKKQLELNKKTMNKLLDVVLAMPEQLFEQ